MVDTACRIYLFFSLFFFVGCDMSGEYDSCPRANFDALWTLLDEHYCFFDYKSVDWDQVYRDYSDRVDVSMSDKDLFSLLRDMICELKDGHTNLESPFGIAKYDQWHTDFPRNFELVRQWYYLGDEEEHKRAGVLKYRQLAGSEYGYLYCGSFSEPINDSDLIQVFTDLAGCKGLIVDVRENGGGSLTNSNRLVECFFKEKTLAGYIQHKTGKAHSAFSEPYPIYITPSISVHWQHPVVVITNRHTYSAGNDFVNKMGLLPRVAIVGDKTGGGSGFPFSSELPNGWRVRFSASPILNIHKEHTEFGIEPDICVSLGFSEEREDALIETALGVLRSHNQPNPEQPDGKANKSEGGMPNCTKLPF